MDFQLSRIFRRVIEISIGLWTTIVFQGVALGSAILFLRYLFDPYITNHLSDTLSLNIPEWLYFMFGIALVLLVKAASRQPLLRDNHREQFEAIEAITRKLPELEQTQVYRTLARKLVDEFRVDTDLKIDLASEANTIVEGTDHRDKQI